MDETTKRHILENCNNPDFTIDILDDCVKDGDITIEELQKYNLEISKVNELKRRNELREQGIYKVEGEEEEEEEDSETNGSVNEAGNPIDKKKAEIEKVLNDKESVETVSQNIYRNNIYTYDDLKVAGLSEDTLRAIKYYSNRDPVSSYKISDLPKMEEGRTDVFFIGMPASGKSTMLAGILKYIKTKGLAIVDAYNNAGNKYQAQLVKDIDRRVLPDGTARGSYNYIATSLMKESENVKHPFNIVEVPGENYVQIFENGLETEEVKGFVNYIKNQNKKILIFVIDAFANEDEDSLAQDQESVFTNIFSMLKDKEILSRTYAVYLVVNKFDVLKETIYKDSYESDPVLAKNYIFEKFRNFKNNILEKRDKNDFVIKIFPYSIGKVYLTQVLQEYNPEYSRAITEHLFEDSFIIK